MAKRKIVRVNTHPVNSTRHSTRSITSQRSHVYISTPGEGKRLSTPAHMDADEKYQDQICAAYRFLSETIGCELRLREIRQRCPGVLNVIMQEPIRQQSDDRATAIQMLDILQEFVTTESLP